MSENSFNAVNYSLRPSKTIQRALVFEGLRRLQEILDWDRARYVGLGSIWFTDFIMAHKILRLTRMISIEHSLIGFRRALFNKPYKFVEVKRGFTYDILPDLFQQSRFQSIPNIFWLDYDTFLNGDMVSELRGVVDAATPGSVLLTTVNVNLRHYGQGSKQVREELSELFGENATRRVTGIDVRQQNLGGTIGNLLLQMLENRSKRNAKANECVRAFLIPYRDKANMVTVGVVFPDEDSIESVKRVLLKPDWPGFVREPVIAPHLTTREASVLQSNLPSRKPLSRSFIRELGFDLEEDQMRAFQQFYRHYPVFAQIFS